MEQSHSRTSYLLLSPSTACDIGPNESIYCEEDYFEVKSDDYYPMACDRSSQSTFQPPLPFNYSKFTEYLERKAQIEFTNRTVKASKGISTPSVDSFTDDTLKNELFKIYGEMDETSPRFLLIFENYKEQRLEQLEEWSAIEAQMRAKDEGIGSEIKDEEEELSNYFTAEELVQFKSISSMEPFLLPRKKRGESKISTKSFSEKKGYLQQRNDIIAKEVVAVLNQSPLGITRDQLIRKCAERFTKIANVPGSRVGGAALNLTSATIEGELSKRDILFTRNYFKEEGYLVFPASLQPALRTKHPKTILWNLKHKFLVVLHMFNGIMEVNECIDQCFQIFHIKNFQYSDWGFKNAAEFIEYLLDTWKTRDVKVIQLNLSNDRTNANNTKHYLAVMTDENRELVEQFSMKNPSSKGNTNPSINLNQPKKSASNSSKLQNINTSLSSVGTLSVSSSSSSSHPKILTQTSRPVWNLPELPNVVEVSSSTTPLLNFDPSALCIRPDFVQRGDNIVRMQDELKPGQIEDCEVSVINSPTSCFLILKRNWIELMRMLGELRNLWSPNEICPHPKFLQMNYICMAKAKTDSDEKENVYRVVIVGKPDSTHYKVFCIDFGDVLTVRHDQLRYLPKRYLTYLEAQAISCSIYNVASPTKDPNGNDIWNETTCQFTKRLFNPPDCYAPIVKVHFKQRVYGKGAWLMKVSSPKCGDFGEEIMKYVNDKK